MSSKTQPDKVNKILEIISKSGNDLHQDVVDLFRMNEWEVKSSPYYNDPATNKPREIDIIAKKKISMREWAGDDSRDISVQLYIECKHISGNNVIWFEPKNISAAEQLAKNNTILHAVEHVGLYSSDRPSRPHHYIEENDVAKRWDKEGHTDGLYDAMNGSLNGLIFFKENSHLSPERYIVNYPVIVVDSYTNLYRRDVSHASGYTAITESFQIEVDYSYTDKDKVSKTAYFLIDVVEKAGLKKFITKLESTDMEILTQRLAFQIRQSAFMQRRERNNNWNSRDSSM